MSEDKDPMVSALELHEEFLQHLERGGGKIKDLSLFTIGITTLLAVAYVSQLALSFVPGAATQTVNMADPTLEVVELVLLALALLWLYIGLRDYRFTRRLVPQIKEIRAAEAELMKKYGLDTQPSLVAD